MQVKIRNDIQFLRAVSVLAVIIYHLNISVSNFQLFKGGFLGVDIFFVISGYLISKILFEKINLKNFKIRNFINKRLRRLFPLIILLNFVVLFLCYTFYDPLLSNKLTKEIISSSFFISNIFYWFNHTFYESDLSLYMPLLHTWSLGVELQFYILSIFIFFFVFSIKKKQLILLLIIFFISFFLSLYLTDHHPNFSFYSILSRLWEFLIGSIIFLKYNLICNFLKDKKKLVNLFLLIIILFFLFFENKNSHPHILTLIFCILSGLLICSPENSFVKKLSNYKFFFIIGGISFSLYIWHNLAFSTYRILFSDQNIFVWFILVFIVFITSLFTFKFIETPFRNEKIISNKLFYSILTISIFIFFILVFYLNSSKGLVFKKYPLILENFYKKANYRQIYQKRIPCHNRDGNFCTFGDKNSDTVIYLVGDSLTDSMLLNFIEFSEQKKFFLVHMSYSANLLLKSSIVYNFQKEVSVTENNLHENRWKEIKSEKRKNKYIVYAAHYNMYFNDWTYEKESNYKKIDSNYNLVGYPIKFPIVNRSKEIINQFSETIYELASENYTVFLLEPLPFFLKTPHENLINLFKKNKNNFEDKINLKFMSSDYSKMKEVNNLATTVIKKIDHPKVIKIDTDQFCKKDLSICPSHDNERLIFFDEFHLTYSGSKIILDKIKNFIK